MKIRASEAEWAEWHAKARAVGLSLSDLVRRSVGRVRTWTVAHTEIERRLQIGSPRQLGVAEFRELNRLIQGRVPLILI